MSNELLEIQGRELEKFMSKVTDSSQYQLVIAELLKGNKISSDNPDSVIAKEIKTINLNSRFMIVKLEAGKVTIVANDTLESLVIDFSIIEDKEDGKYLDQYSVVNSKIQFVGTTLYDQKFKDLIEEINKNKIPEELNRKNIVSTMGVPCLHGNWCGPGCSGPGSPIDAVDRCCQAHDKCYERKGYFSCSCDVDLLACLKPYVTAGSEWANLIYTYFLYSPCNPF